MMKLAEFDLKWAQTLDGQLCDDTDVSQWITGAEELKHTHEIRKSYDAVLVGGTTFLADLCQLTVRHVPLDPERSQPVRLILDRSGRVWEALMGAGSGAVLDALKQGGRPTVILGARAPEALSLPASVHFVHTDLDFSRDRSRVIQELCAALRKAERACGRSLQSVLVEGGATLLTWMLRHSLQRRVYVSIAPCLTGGRKHRLYIDRVLKDCVRLKLGSVRVLGSDLVAQMGTHESA